MTPTSVLITGEQIEFLVSLDDKVIGRLPYSDSDIAEAKRLNIDLEEYREIMESVYLDEDY